MTERVLFGPGGATEGKQDAALTALAGLLTEATFAAEDFATQATLEAARVLLAAIKAGQLPAGHSVTVANPTVPQTDALTDTQLRAAVLDIRALTLAVDSVRQVQRTMSSYVATLTSPTTATAAAITNRARLLRLDGGSKPTNTDGTYVAVTISIGATAVMVKTLQPGEPFGGQVCLEGAVGDDITVALTGSGDVEFNLRYEEFS